MKYMRKAGEHFALHTRVADCRGRKEGEGSNGITKFSELTEFLGEKAGNISHGGLQRGKRKRQAIKLR